MGEKVLTKVKMTDQPNPKLLAVIIVGFICITVSSQTYNRHNSTTAYILSIWTYLDDRAMLY
jgi:hypothetical protein